MIRSFSIRYVWHVLEPCQKANPVLRKKQHIIDIHQGMNLRPNWGKTVKWIRRHFFWHLSVLEFYISFLDPLLLPFIALHELVRCMLFELMHREVVGVDMIQSHVTNRSVCQAT